MFLAAQAADADEHKPCGGFPQRLLCRRSWKQLAAAELPHRSISKLRFYFRQNRQKADRSVSGVLAVHSDALRNPCGSSAVNERSPKANLMVSSAPFQADAPHEVAAKARFPGSEPIPTAQSGLSCQRNPTPENPVKSRFFSPESPKAPQNGLSRQRNPASTLMM